jgi:hypothetical protein
MEAEGLYIQNVSIHPQDNSELRSINLHRRDNLKLCLYLLLIQFFVSRKNVRVNNAARVSVELVRRTGAILILLSCGVLAGAGFSPHKSSFPTDKIKGPLVGLL